MLLQLATTSNRELPILVKTDTRQVVTCSGTRCELKPQEDVQHPDMHTHAPCKSVIDTEYAYLQPQKALLSLTIYVTSPTYSSQNTLVPYYLEKFASANREGYAQEGKGPIEQTTINLIEGNTSNVWKMCVDSTQIPQVQIRICLGGLISEEQKVATQKRKRQKSWCFLYIKLLRVMAILESFDTVVQVCCIMQRQNVHCRASVVLAPLFALANFSR